jgi:hypothetical protein
MRLQSGAEVRRRFILLFPGILSLKIEILHSVAGERNEQINSLFFSCLRQMSMALNSALGRTKVRYERQSKQPLDLESLNLYLREEITTEPQEGEAGLSRTGCRRETHAAQTSPAVLQPAACAYGAPAGMSFAFRQRCNGRP